MKLLSLGKRYERATMTAATSTNWKGSISETDMSDDGEPKLQIVDPYESEANMELKPRLLKSFSVDEEASNASEAVESLLMLGQSDVWSESSIPVSQGSRMRTKSWRMTSSNGDGILTREEKGVVTYYQKMRERNNEASKRCRLKRRLKAESLETQLNFLASANSMLKQRIARMESIGQVFKDGIQSIQLKDCQCTQTVSLIKQINRRYKETMDLTNAALLKTSKSYREQNPELILQSSSDDDFPLSNSPVPPPFYRTNSTPVFVKMESSHPKPEFQTVLQNTPPTRAMTALDVLNETILKSLGPSTSPPSPLNHPDVSSSLSSPLNLVKILPPPNPQPEPSNVILPEPQNHLNVKIKKEPETCEKVFGVDRVETCVAAGIEGSCKGNLLNLNKLTSFLNTLSCQAVSIDDSTSAMERAIIKSRLRSTFWKSEEAPSFICEGHRQIILFNRGDEGCVNCGRKRPKKLKSSASLMYSLTYRISLENHLKNGSILPIGRFVCGFCKDKLLKGIDMSQSLVLTPDMPTIQYISSDQPASSDQPVLSNTVSVRPSMATPLKRPGTFDQTPPSDMMSLVPVKIRPSPPCFATARNNTEVQVIIQPVQKDSLQVKPAPASIQVPSNKPADNIFTKISRLNDALHEINPKYKPIGFSITSIESCSPSILQDAVAATETAFSTLMSIIAPGQESFLWESIKPILDNKLNSPQGLEQTNFGNNNLH